MKIQLAARVSRTNTVRGITQRPHTILMTNSPLTPHGVGEPRHTKNRVLSGSIFRMLRETLGAIVMITHPEKVRETLGLLESEPGIRQVTHD